MKFNKKWLVAALIVAVVALPLAVKKSRGATGIAVDMAVAAAQDVRPTILASGTLAYRNEVNLTAEVVAKVAMIAVKEGDTVEAGQLLMRLDPETYNNAIEREEAGLRQNRISIERQRAALSLRAKQFERSKQLVAAQIIDRNRFDEDRNQLEMARADLRGSEEALRRSAAVVGEAHEQRAKTEIRSPIAGRIVSLPIKVGETAIPSSSSLAGAQLMKIADTSAIQAELKVDEADIAKIAVGQHVDLYPAAYPDQPLKGVIDQIALAPTIEGQGRAYKVTVRMTTPPTLHLRSGMSARADIFLSDGKKRLAVPVEAVVSETGEDDKVSRYVWLQHNGRAKKVKVSTGVSDDRWESISAGVARGDSVIVGPGKVLRTLQAGDPVVPRSADDKTKEMGKDDDQDDAE
ncbi:MAG: efflux RND transporter periplasmic adaptor subunit [Lysobacter sp.]